VGAIEVASIAIEARVGAIEVASTAIEARVGAIEVASIAIEARATAIERAMNPFEGRETRLVAGGKVVVVATKGFNVRSMAFAVPKVGVEMAGARSEAAPGV
jgi:hypothetical protein